MAMRKLSFYIKDADATIKCDHLPLKKFLQKQMLNAKVNNWAMELEQFNLKVEWIQGVKNALADSLSKLLEVDPEAKLQPEKEGHEFGTFCFEELNETAEISPNCWVPATDFIENIEITYDEENAFWAYYAYAYNLLYSKSGRQIYARSLRKKVLIHPATSVETLVMITGVAQKKLTWSPKMLGRT